MLNGFFDEILIIRSFHRQGGVVIDHHKWRWAIKIDLL
ncbi:hypothetical protein GM3709_2680 [Geminocystis sp. NIES-3709]|nr:hypothetical protein GM3709_2680 [Geminocystis sp. NIES-3709]